VKFYSLFSMSKVNIETVEKVIRRGARGLANRRFRSKVFEHMEVQIHRGRIPGSYESALPVESL